MAGTRHAGRSSRVEDETCPRSTARSVCENPLGRTRAPRRRAVTLTLVPPGRDLRARRRISDVLGPFRAELGPRMNLHPDLESELRRTLLAEFGARAIYGQLAALTRDDELTKVLRRLQAEEVEQVRELRAVFAALGLRARKRSFRRWCLAGSLATFAAVFGVRFALRICCDAERTASRWYATYRTWLFEAGQLELAETCGRLGLNKHRHAEILSTWVEHAPRRT